MRNTYFIPNMWHHVYMWHDFLDLIFPPRPDERTVRAISKEFLDAHFSLTTINATDPPTLGLLPFREPHIRACIHECKYHSSSIAQTHLSYILTRALRAQLEKQSSSTAHVVAMPLSPQRLSERGYNQTERIVKPVAHTLHLPLSQPLQKIRDTKTQTTLSRALRLQNQQGAFVATHTNPDITYFLIDDVITTGATMQSAINALRQDGARFIVPIALTY